MNGRRLIGVHLMEVRLYSEVTTIFRYSTTWQRFSPETPPFFSANITENGKCKLNAAIIFNFTEEGWRFCRNK